MMKTTGIHHITAFVSDAQRNLDFYAGVLGLRLVKQTINFDSPDVYHFYFGDEQGSPGSIMTFFPFSRGRKGRIGTGQVGVTTYVVPKGTLSFWRARLTKFGITYEEVTRFSENFLKFSDYDGLRLELVEREDGKMSKWSFGGVPADKAIKGFGGAVLYSTNPKETSEILEHVMGLEKVGEDGNFVRFRGVADLGNIVDIDYSVTQRGVGGAGTVHHIAWRAKDFKEHKSWRDRVGESGFEVTPIIDRQYFNAIYFREQGEILFEIATDPPGFTSDESPEDLGKTLQLPSWYETHREEIKKNLPQIEIRVLEEDL
jgi:glyoxalase family protein